MLWGLLRGILGVQTVAHLILNFRDSCSFHFFSIPTPNPKLYSSFHLRDHSFGASGGFVSILLSLIKHTLTQQFRVQGLGIGGCSHSGPTSLVTKSQPRLSTSSHLARGSWADGSGRICGGWRESRTTEDPNKVASH